MTVSASGSTLREVIADVERQHPDFEGRVVQGGSVRPEVFLTVGTEEAFGLDVSVAPDAEIFIVPAIAGGAPDRRNGLASVAFAEGRPTADG